MTASNAPTKRTREVAIQVPGAPADTQAPAGSDSAKIETEAQGAREVDVQVPGAAPKQDLSQESNVEQESAMANAMATQGAGIGMDSLRAELLAQARAEVHAELGEQLNAATAVLKQAAPTPLARGAYRNMRAADIDHTKLKAPVLSADGWVCPPAPAAKV